MALMEARRTQANYALRLQVSLEAEERLAKAEGTTLNPGHQLGGGRLRSCVPPTFFRERARRGDVDGALARLDRLGIYEPPLPQDKPRSCGNKQRGIDHHQR
jgi:hypothetical protein